MEKKTHILMVCGEASGDLNASLLAKALRTFDPGLEISGVGGTLLAQAGVKVFYDIQDLAVMGFFDVLIKLPRFLRLKKLILKKIAEEKPRAIILVDFSGFNLRLAKAIRRSVPVIYYISPQVWASRSGRLKTIKDYVSKVIVLFQFEQEFYRRHGIDADFVGHPLLDSVFPSMERKEFQETFGLFPSKKTIALLPGSRKQEIHRLLPIMLETAALIKKNLPDVQFVIAKSAHVTMDIYYRHLKKFGESGLEAKIIENKTYDCLGVADFCLICSGTAILEAAIMQRPFCLMYTMSGLNYLLYRPQVKVPYIGIVNIVAGKHVIEEFIQGNARPTVISRYILRVLSHPEALETMQRDLGQIKPLLGEKGACGRAAKRILDFLNPSP